MRSYPSFPLLLLGSILDPTQTTVKAFSLLPKLSSSPQSVVVPFPSRRAFASTQGRKPSIFHGATAETEPEFFPEEDLSGLEGLTEERKQSLFQFLLRDLQVEGVPLLECDVNQEYTLQLAMWTTMAELSEQEEGQKVCLVLESMPIDSLRSLVGEFTQLKRDLLAELPELKRFNVTLVGRGVGPAIVIETANSTSIGDSEGGTICYDEYEVNAVMKSFISQQATALGLSSSTITASSEIEENQNLDTTIGYRISPSTRVCQILSSFWNSICEVLTMPEESLRGIVLTLPNLKATGREMAHLEALTKLINRSVSLACSSVEVIHVHPQTQEDDKGTNEGAISGPYTGIILKRAHH